MKSFTRQKKRVFVLFLAMTLFLQHQRGSTLRYIIRNEAITEVSKACYVDDVKGKNLMHHRKVKSIEI